jgi:predicted aspartyl protease
VALDGQRLVSPRFPYLPLRFRIGNHVREVEAFLDTGFDGGVAIPAYLSPTDRSADGATRWELADASEVLAPYYVATVEFSELGTLPTVVTVLGDEPLVGRMVTDKFSIMLDHGTRVIVEP